MASIRRDDIVATTFFPRVDAHEHLLPGTMQSALEDSGFDDITYSNHDDSRSFTEASGLLSGEKHEQLGSDETTLASIYLHGRR